jgi:hypothetical protein
MHIKVQYTVMQWCGLESAGIQDGKSVAMHLLYYPPAPLYLDGPGFPPSVLLFVHVCIRADD